MSVSRSILKDRARGDEGGPGGVMYVEGGREEHLLSLLDSLTGKKAYDRGIGRTPYAVENFPYLRCPGTV